MIRRKAAAFTIPLVLIGCVYVLSHRAHPTEASDKTSAKAHTKSPERVRAENDSPLSERGSETLEQRIEAFLTAKGRTPANLAAVAIAGGRRNYRNELQNFPNDPAALVYRLIFPEEDPREILSLLQEADPDHAIVHLLHLRLSTSQETSPKNTLQILLNTASSHPFGTHEEELMKAAFDLRVFLGDSFAQAWNTTFLGQFSLTPKSKELDLVWIDRATRAIAEEPNPQEKANAIHKARNFAELMRHNSPYFDQEQLAFKLERSVISHISAEECREEFGMNSHQHLRESTLQERVSKHHQATVSIALEEASPEILVEMEKIYRARGISIAERYLLEYVDMEKVRERVVPLRMPEEE